MASNKEATLTGWHSRIAVQDRACFSAPIGYRISGRRRSAKAFAVR